MIRVYLFGSYDWWFDHPSALIRKISLFRSKRTLSIQRNVFRCCCPYKCSFFLFWRLPAFKTHAMPWIRLVDRVINRRGPCHNYWANQNESSKQWNGWMMTGSYRRGGGGGGEDEGRRWMRWRPRRWKGAQIRCRGAGLIADHSNITKNNTFLFKRVPFREKLAFW